MAASFLALGLSSIPDLRTVGLLGALVSGAVLGSDLLFGTTAVAILGALMDRSDTNIDGTPLDRDDDRDDDQRDGYNNRRADRTTASSIIEPSPETITPSPLATAAS